MTDPTTPSLLPCPFCGGEAKLESTWGVLGECSIHHVVCSVCGCSGVTSVSAGVSAYDVVETTFDAKSYFYQEAARSAVDSWNRRAPAPVPEALLAMAQLLRTQDNRITDQPIFMVQGLRRHYGFDSDYSDVYVWFDEDQEQADPEQEAELETLGYEDTGVWRRVYYRDEWEHLQPFLTEAGAKEYLRINGHNLSHFMSVRIYVESAYRNGDWKTIREFLLSLPEGK